MKLHYVGKVVRTGKIFASSFHTGSQPIRFVLGSVDAPVAGWNQGLDAMCEGERRRLIVPWELGYGTAGAKGGRTAGQAAPTILHVAAAGAQAEG
jgi:FKBP-type peptidyl-prolyl cis-trans isomerase